MPTPLEGTPAWWLVRLNKRLNEKARRDRLTKLDNYYHGRHPLLFATDEFYEIFVDVLQPLSINFVSLVVDATVERLKVQGFRSGENAESAANANQVWRDNDMDAWAVVAHREALVKSETAVIVWTEAGKPQISVEDARTVIVDYYPGRLKSRQAALKRWADDTRAYATLYLPDAIYKFEQSLSGDDRDAIIDGASVGIISDTTPYGWKRREVSDEAWPLPNPTGVVPVIPMVNRPDLFGRGQSEMESVLPQQDAINKLACDLLIASEFAAFPQRWMTGVETRDETTGEDTFDFRGAIDRLLTVPNPDAKMGIFQAADLDNYTGAIEAFVQQMASISHTPPHYLLGRSGVVPSGEATTSAESGLVSKVKSHQSEKGPVWAEVLRVADLVMDRREAPALAPIWEDPERRSWSERADALAKERSLGIPDEYLWKKLGYNADDIAEIRRMRDDEARRLAQAFDPNSLYFDPEALKTRTESFRRLVDAGVDPASAAAQAGMPELVHTGDRPVSTRPAEV